MNVLPVRPQLVWSDKERACYFDDLEALGFGAACISCCALPQDLVTGEYRDAYFNFAAEALHRGYLACVRIHCSLSSGSSVVVSEAQRDASDQPLAHGDGFFASLASVAWRAHVKELIEVFVRELGYQCVILEGIESRVDIPGLSDPFVARFNARYPGSDYPAERRETAEYLRVQQEKSAMTMDFCVEMAAHAKSVGAKHVGLAPGVFSPIASASLDGTPNPACDATLLARIPEVDFVVSSLSPDDLYRTGLQTGDDMAKSAAVFQTEVLAFSSGKRTLALGGSSLGTSDVPAGYLSDCVNSALAAAPCGFVTEWLGEPLAKQNYSGSLTEAAECSGRLGRPSASVAFVFSYSGTRHVSPNTYDDVYQSYWALAKQMAFKERMPILTFHAETLQQDLVDHPEVQVLVFDEHFPLGVEQMMVIRNWWQGSQRRAAVAFGVGQGYSADVDAPGPHPSGQAYPGMMELIGLKNEEPYVVRFDQPVALHDVSRVRRSAFLGDDLPARISAVAGIRRVFGSRANVLYEVDYQENRVPVVAEWRDRTTLAVFCGFGLSGDTTDMAIKAIYYALREVDAPQPIIDSCTDDVLWCVNRHDYVVISNLSDNPGSAVARPGRANVWDCRERRLLPDGDPTIELAPHSSRVLRIVGRRSKFLDVIGCSCLRSLIDGAGRAEIELVAGKSTVFVLRSSPKEIQVDGRACIVTQEVVDGAYYVTLQQCPPGDRKITLKW